MSTERRLAAILAADVVGSSRLIEADEAYALTEIRAVLSEILVAHSCREGGRLIKTMGDGALIEFPSPVSAVSCAVDVQRQLAIRAAAAKPDRRILLRIGINLGDIVGAPDGDVYGDGVNVAARLEAISAPGGIAISHTVHDHLAGKCSLAWHDKGEVALKNIVRPVRVYATSDILAPAASPAPPLPDRPSLAVLPFTNLSGDPEQEYFADGLVEDIITALSRVKSFFVIARNSSFTYKGKAVDIRQVGRELGVRYVLEGSVRKAGGRVRITGQLIEAESGRHLWADRFDGSLEDVFDLQDRITESVAAIIEPSVSAAEIARATVKATDNLDAYDLFLRALPHHYGMTREGCGQAHGLLERAVALDSTYSLAKAFDAFTYVVQVAQGWGSPEDRAKGTRLAKEAIAANRDDPLTLRLAGHAMAHLGREFEMAGAALERAVVLNPNSAQVRSSAGWVSNYLGHSEAAIDHFRRAIRLSPLDPEMGYFLSGLAHSYWCLGHNEEALEYASGAVREMPAWLPGSIIKTLALVALGRMGEARQAMALMLQINPNLTAPFVNSFVCNPNPDYRARYIGGLVLAGLPE